MTAGAGDSPAAPAAQGSYDPGEHTVAEVQEWVTAHPDQADAVLTAELAGKARTTLVAWLEELSP